MESLLGNLFGDAGSDEERRAKAADFVKRVESGAPTEGFSAAEALTNYSKVASNLSPNELEEAATQALQRFSPEQRREFSQLLQQKTGAAASATDDPREIAQLTSQLQGQSPDGLVGLLGGGSLDDVLGGLLGGGGSSSGGGGGFLNDLLGGLLGGGKKNNTVASTSSGGVGDLLGNPIAQAILAAIAAMAMKKFAGDGGGLGDLIPGLGGDQPGGAANPPAAATDKPARGGLKGADPTNA